MATHGRAPPPATAAPPPGFTSGLDESVELRLEGTAREKREVAELAELFALLHAVDHLETAYVRDLVAPEAYTPACSNLIGKFKLQLDTLKGMGAIESLEVFLRDYSVRLPQAYKRLVIDGVPATALHKSADARAENVAIAETVSCMITALDCLKLGQTAIGACGGARVRWRQPALVRAALSVRAWCARTSSAAHGAHPAHRAPRPLAHSPARVCTVDEVTPLVSAVCESLSKAPMIRGDHPLKAKLEDWCVRARARGGWLVAGCPRRPAACARGWRVAHPFGRGPVSDRKSVV